MPERITIRRYEYETIAIGEDGFHATHFERLVQWNERNANRFFTVGHNRVYCTNHVGVVQIGSLVIEVLPKADRNAGINEQGRWQQALLTMLHVAHDLPLYEAQQASLRLRHTSLLDFFFGLYVREVQRLVHRGLVKQYHTVQGNLTALKGRLDFPRHLRHNLVHRERFGVVHQTYDTDHLLHSILGGALHIAQHTTQDGLLKGRMQDLAWAFERVADRPINAATFQRLRLGRKTNDYSRAVQLAKLIILNYSPDLQSGREPVLGILFEMERLWEKFMLRLLKRDCPEGSTVSGQETTDFWEDRSIRPDIVITSAAGERTIVDTKWKMPDEGKPAMSDLQQLFAYNVQFGCDHSVLLYPGDPGSVRGEYASAGDGWRSKELPHWCSMAYAMPFRENGQLNSDANFFADLFGIRHFAFGTEAHTQWAPPTSRNRGAVRGINPS